MNMIRNLLVSISALGLLVAVGCGSDDGAKKKDDANTAKAEPAAEEPAEEPAAEEPAAEPAADLSAFDGAGTATEATSKGGKAGMMMGAVTADGAFATCGLKDNDIVVAIDGAAVQAGRAGAMQLKKACAAGGAVTVERAGAEVPAK